MKRSPLKRRTPLFSHPRKRKVTSAEAIWKAVRWGRCENCGRLSARPLHGHHVIRRQLLRGTAFEFDPRNRMDLCETCHWNHHYGQRNRKIRLENLPLEALKFAAEVLGPARASVELERSYDCVSGGL